ncbi:MAG: class I SAM-dependent methyltransferase [Rhizobiaceae bacterium]|nr:class I SAM-dependent methyltransferase [Rhizobiaceae bacterium]
MAQAKSHEALVGEQFGSQAGAYLTSTVHATGADLAALAALVAGRRGARVLDLGCGAGHVSFAVAPHAEQVTAYDLSGDMLAVVGESAAARGLANVVTRQGVAEALPFADASFDFVLSRYSAHHWQDVGAALRETKRVLKPGGVAAIVDVISPGVPLFDTWLQALELLRDPSHVRDYGRAEWEAAIAQAGLAVEAADTHRIRLEFGPWVERMRTPAVQVEAIRALQSAMSEGVRRHFEVDEAGSFSLSVATFRAVRP